MSDSVKPPETPPASPPVPPAAMVTVPKHEQVELFELMQRKAATFARSALVPEHIRGKMSNDAEKQQGIANCYICLVLAEQMGENPLVVMQNIYIVHGKPGWSASYMIAKANASGIFKGVVRFKHEGSGATRSCTASATLADTGEKVEATVSMEMARAEGWAKNSKYQTMPDQMLIYRSGTFLVRTYCPHVMLGYHTEDELRDVDAALGTVDAEVEPAKVLDALKARVAEATPDAVVIDAAPKSNGEPPKSDKLTELAAEFEAKCGDWKAFFDQHGGSYDEMENSGKAKRAQWCDKIHQAIRGLGEPAASMPYKVVS